MRRSIITALAALCLTAAALAQNAKIDGIRKEYAAIKADVADLQRAGAKGKWYVLTMDDNAYGRRYVGSDHFRARLHFYYELESETVIPILRYATEEVEADEQRIRREALYTDGQPVYIYEKDSDQDNVERTLFLNEGEPIQYAENNKVLTGDEATDAAGMLLWQAENLMKRFEGSFGDSPEDTPDDDGEVIPLGDE